MAVAAVVAVVVLGMMRVQGGLSAAFTMEVHLNSSLDGQFYTLTKDAKSSCLCRTMCQTWPPCTAVSISSVSTDTSVGAPGAGLVTCGLSEEPNPQSLLQTSDTSNVIVITSRLPPRTTTASMEVTTAPPLNVEDYVSKATTADGTKWHMDIKCQEEGGFAAFHPSSQFMRQLGASDMKDKNTDIDSEHGIWIYLTYDTMAKKHKMFDGNYLEDVPDYSKFTMEGREHCFRLKKGKIIAQRNCADTVNLRAVACAKII